MNFKFVLMLLVVAAGALVTKRHRSKRLDTLSACNKLRFKLMLLNRHRPQLAMALYKLKLDC